MDWKNLTDKQIEAIESGRMPPSIHPHHPFIFVDLIRGLETPPLVTLWLLRRDFRLELVARCRALAKTRNWAWHQCSELYKHLTRNEDEIPEPLRGFLDLPLPKHRGRPEESAEYFLLDEIVRLLVSDGYSQGKADKAVALAIVQDPLNESAVDAAVKRVERARKRVRDTMRKEESV